MTWAKTPISFITSKQHSHRDIIIALQEAIQHNAEVSEPSNIFFGQYINHPRDIKKYCEGSSQYRRMGSKLLGTHKGQLTVHGPNQWTRSPSRTLQGSNSQGRDRSNPTIKRNLFCWGCGSPDHFLFYRKCTPTVGQICSNMFRLADDGMIEQESILAWAQYVHLAFVTNADDHPEEKT